MLKRHMAVCLLATALAGGVAVAQTSAPSATAASGQFVTEQAGTHWLASKLVGVDVYGSDNAKIGDINEVLVSKDGAAEAVVIGVGGFLGIGEKNVAVPFKSLEWMDSPRPTASTTTTTTTDTTGSTAPRPPAATTTTTSNAPAASAASRGYPDHAMVKMSKADLQNAPAFRYASEAARPATTSAPMGTAPAPKQ